MKDVVRAILRSLGIKLEDVVISRVHDDLGNGLTIPTNAWIISFDYKEFRIVIDLINTGAKDSWMLLAKYSLYDVEMFDLHRVELADITAEELREIIKEFIERKEERK